MVLGNYASPRTGTVPTFGAAYSPFHTTGLLAAAYKQGGKSLESSQLSQVLSR